MLNPQYTMKNECCAEQALFCYTVIFPQGLGPWHVVPSSHNTADTAPPPERNQYTFDHCAQWGDVMLWAGLPDVLFFMGLFCPAAFIKKMYKCPPFLKMLEVRLPT